MDYRNILTPLTLKHHRRDGSVTLFPTTAELEQMETAATYKPVHGGYPTAQPSNPIPGSEWNEDQSQTLYSNAKLLEQILSQIAREAGVKAWKLSEAVRNFRLYPGYENTARLQSLYETYMQEADSDLKVRLLVEQLVLTIDADVRPEKKLDAGSTIYPSMERYYAFRPVWDFIANFRNAFKRIDA